MATKIIFETKYVIPFDDFLANIGDIDLWMKLPIPEKSIIEEWQSITYKTHIPDYEFKWVFLDLRWSYWLIKSITIKHLLYIYYHHIFNIKMFSFVKQKWLSYENNEEAIIYNEYITDRKRWYEVRCYTKDDDNTVDLRKILEKFAPNQWYDKKEAETNPELILQSGEIFEYFTSISKNERNPDYKRIQKRLIDEGVNDGISAEELQKQLDVVENFLSNILK